MAIKGRVSLIGGILVVILVLAGLYFGFLKDNFSQKSIESLLSDKQLVTDLAAGKCTIADQDNLKKANLKASNIDLAKYYENLGICAVFNKDFTAAKAAYTQSLSFYKKAGNGERAELVDGALQSVSEEQDFQKAKQDMNSFKQNYKNEPEAN